LAKASDSAFIGEHHLAAGTVDQPDADPSFQRLQTLRHGRRRDVHLPGSFSERGRLGQHVEEAQILGGQHLVRS
jgi:hypothetical protein